MPQKHPTVQIKILMLRTLTHGRNMWKLILTKLRKRSYKKIIDEVEPPPQSTEEQQSLEIVNRTCSVSMNKIIRSDLPPEIRDVLTKKLQETMSRVSNYIANLSEVVFLTMLLFKNGLNLSEILPPGFLPGAVQKFGPVPLSMSSFNAENTKEINSLFQEAHLSLIHSNYFGARGQAQSSTESQNLKNSLFECLSSYRVSGDTYKDNDMQLSSLEMSIARGIYNANFKTMWEKKQPSDTANVQEIEEDFVEDEMNNDEPKPVDSDISRKRLLSLKATTKHVLLSKETGNTEELLKDCCSEISKEELIVAALIVNLLAPYIPSKELSFDIVQQLLFILLANEFFEITSYQKFTRNICPMSSLSLNTLRIDGPALYHMISRKVENSPREEEKSSYLQTLNDPEVVQELNNDEAVIREEIGFLRSKISTLTNQLRISFEEETIIDYYKQKKDLKLQWRYDSDILQMNDIFTKIQHATACQKDGSKALYDLSNYKNVAIKAEDAYVNRETVTNDNTLFYGTDNGVVTMTNTVRIVLNRFKFRLELYNRYDALSDINENHSMEDIIEKYNTNGDGNNAFLKLLVCKKITAADIDVGTRHRKARRKSERKKKTTEDGKRILQIEKSLSETPLNSNLDKVP
ncbi:hypothetical protein EDC94DRAFT_661101 [Helicostylum pulchrum]|nr:hypothetical protein EDC94DRAFT_661101 [Helicostylum pulchrum]